MPKRSSKRADINEVAFSIVARATGGAAAPVDDAVDVAAEPDEATVRAAAAALGRRGGLRGGPARASALTPAKRRAIAKKAAAARWHGRKR
jgi:hypothetical protein